MDRVCHRGGWDFGGHWVDVETAWVRGWIEIGDGLRGEMLLWVNGEHGFSNRS